MADRTWPGGPPRLGRPAGVNKHYTRTNRDRVEKLCTMNVPHERMAIEFDMEVPEFRAVFAREIRKGAARRLNDIDALLYDAAAAKNVTAMKVFYQRRGELDPRTLKQIEDEAEKRAARAAAAATPQPKAPKLGKKEIAQQEAEKAGVGSEWGDDLSPWASSLN